MFTMNILISTIFFLVGKILSERLYSDAF